MQTTERNVALPLISFLLLLLLFTAASPLFIGEAEFSGDDYYYISNNFRVTTHTPAALREIWKHPMRIEYFPLTITTYALEHRLWGDSVKLYRLTNLLLFIGIGIAAWSLTVRLHRILRPEEESPVLPAAAAALTGLFLLHPLNVESFACISNRKELLYALFALLAIRTHLSPRPRIVTVILTILFILLAQLSKGSAIILPPILLIATFTIPAAWRMTSQRLVGIAAGSLLAIPLFLYQYRIAVRAGVVAQEMTLPLLSRIGGVVRTLHTMLSKFFLPVNLTYEYDIPWPTALPPLSEWLLPTALAAALIILTLRRQYRILLVTLLPIAAILPYANVIPLKHNIAGKMVFYDHYLLLGTMLIPPILSPVLFPKGRISRLHLIPIGAIMLLFTIMDYRLSGYWQTRETLYSRMIQISPGISKPYLFLAKMYVQQNRYQDAIRMLLPIIQKRVKDPLDVDAFLVMANAQAFSGNYPLAETYYRKYLQYSPSNLQALQNLTATLLELRRCREAHAVIEQWLEAYPGDPNAMKSKELADDCSRTAPSGGK
ncbi:MAG: membrane protein [Desulfuromonadia bacterium]